MPQELCHLALRQTLDLIGLTDEALKDLTRRKFNSDELYHEVLGKLLGGNGRRGPHGILIANEGPGAVCCNGRVFHLQHGELLERSDQITIEPGSTYASSLLMVEGGSEAVALNWSDSCASIEEFQTFFHPQVVAAMGEPILNFVSCRISGDVRGVIEAFNYAGHVTEYDADVLRSAAVMIGSLLTVSNGMRETEHAFHYTIHALARACEAAEPDTGRHIVRVNRYAGALAANMGFNTEFVDDISLSAQMHDVGKIRIPTEILLKEGRLTPREMKLVRQHPAYGSEIIGDSPRLRIAREIAISHHENWDGTGYPKRLKGERIPISGRIVKVADVYDALRSRRSYKGAMTHEETLDVFRNGDNRINPAAHFDPAVLAAFFRIEHMFEMIYDSSVLKLGLDRAVDPAKIK
ncbi:HD domain-containing protein [Geomonas nitrogeniifigens]|uniref:HD-GYP domain-containing protein n=1 Tax=Geomonas diazotrophica TaxID=2843197 RepID=UPI001C2BE6DA|nr:HD domain-containing phosphohydrolase [Geomonas nitrogeniifigens]QXE87914.1 HD domain-containing protein [Geomonas nitrogeniifigens]